MTENDRLAWLQLAFTPYVGAEGFLLLLQRFGSAKAALDAPAEQIAAIVRHKQAAESWRNAEKRALAQKAGGSRCCNGKRGRLPLLLLQDDDFPKCCAGHYRAAGFVLARQCATAAQTFRRHCRQPSCHAAGDADC